MGEVMVCAYCGKLIGDDETAVEVREGFDWVAHLWCAADREYEEQLDREAH